MAAKSCLQSQFQSITLISFAVGKGQNMEMVPKSKRDVMWAPQKLPKPIPFPTLFAFLLSFRM